MPALKGLRRADIFLKLGNLTCQQVWPN